MKLISVDKIREYANKISISPVMIIGICVFFAVFLSTAIFIIEDKKPQAWDQALHMTCSFLYYQLTRAFNFGDFVKVSNYYPPFFHLSSVPLYFLFGFSEDVAIATNLIFYAVLVFSVFKIGEHFGDKETGILAAILVSFYPLLLILQREYMLDFALTAMCALALLLLLKSDCFRKPLITALFGITFGLCELTKWSAFVFILPAIFAIFMIEFGKIRSVCAQCGKKLSEKFFVEGLYRFCSKRCAKIFAENPRPIVSIISSTQITNIIIAFALAIVVLGWWYIPNWEEVSIRLKHFSTIRGVREGDPTIFTLEGWLYYIKALDVSMGLLFFVLALFSLIFLLKRKDKRAVFFFISVIIPYLILTAMSNKGDRYILPVLPVLAVSTAIFLRELPHAFRRVEGKKLQRFLMAVILFVGMMQLLTVTVGFPKIENSLLYPKPVAPDTADWKIDELLSAINQNGGGAVVVLPDHPYLNGQSLNFYRLKNGYNFPVFNGVYIGYETVKANFDRIKYFVLIEPREHESGVFGEEEARLYQLFYEKQQNFERIVQFSLPDNTSLLLYKRKE